MFAGPPEDEVERAERADALSTLEAAVGELDDEQLGDLCWCHPDFLRVGWEEMPEPIRAELIRRGLGAKVEGAWRIHRAVVVLALGVSPDGGRVVSRSAARRMLAAVVQRAPAEAIAYYLAGRETSVLGARRRCLESARPLVIAATHTRRRPPR